MADRIQFYRRLVQPGVTIDGITHYPSKTDHNAPIINWDLLDQIETNRENRQPESKPSAFQIFQRLGRWFQSTRD